jgi:hypothetical protein
MGRYLEEVFHCPSCSHFHSPIGAACQTGEVVASCYCYVRVPLPRSPPAFIVKGNLVTIVIPAEAGIQNVLNFQDSGSRPLSQAWPE